MTKDVAVVLGEHIIYAGIAASDWRWAAVMFMLLTMSGWQRHQDEKKAQADSELGEGEK